MSLVLAMAGIAVASSDNGSDRGATTAATTQVRGCVSKKSGTLRVLKARGHCRRRERALTWNIQGPTGPRGPAGPEGTKGPAGEAGPRGPAGADFDGADAGGVLTGKYPNPSLADGAVGSAQLALGAVTSNKIVANAVGQSQLASSAVTSGKLGLQVVTTPTGPDSTSPKISFASCPGTKQIIAGGAGVTQNDQTLLSNAALLSYSTIDNGQNRWVARASEPVATSDGWRLVVFAVCMRK